MKAICDVHISYKLLRFLQKQKVDVIHVNDILKKWNTSDSEISQYADENKLIVITKDADFRNRFFLQKKPQRLIKISLGNISNEELISLFDKNLDRIKTIYQNHSSFYVEMAQSCISVILLNN